MKNNESAGEDEVVTNVKAYQQKQNDNNNETLKSLQTKGNSFDTIMKVNIEMS